MAYRSSEVPALWGISKSNFHSLIARGYGPPAIQAQSGHTTLYLAQTLADYLAKSQEAGRLLTRMEYLDAVKADRDAAEAAEQRRMLKAGAA
jgi:hypothetical protein